MIYVNNSGVWTLEAGDIAGLPTAGTPLRKGDIVGDRDFLTCSIKDSGGLTVEVQINVVDPTDEAHWKTAATLDAANPTTNVYIPAGGRIRPNFTAGADTDAFVAK